MKKVLSIFVLSLFWACQQPAALTYPETKKKPVVDTYFDTEVVDNYRWLEDDLSEETAQWVETQNTLTFEELEKIPFRAALQSRLEKLWNYEKIGAPYKEGEYTYFSKNEGLQNQYVIYRYYDHYHNFNKAFFFLTQAVAKQMKANGGGGIVTIGSMWVNKP